MKYVPNRKAAEILGVHPNTLRKWADEGKIPHKKTPAGYRLYAVEEFLGIGKKKRHVCYCRVSSHKQKDDLERQVAFMRNRHASHEIITDIGSGLNFKRKGLVTLLESVCSGDVEEVVVAHKDRLCRFGFDLIKWFIESNGGKLVVLNDVSLSPQAELSEDLLAIIHVFSCRMHGLRKYRNQIEKDTALSEPEPKNTVQDVVRDAKKGI